LGASLKPERYAFKAVLNLLRNNIDVIAMGLGEGKIGSVSITKPYVPLNNIHTVSVYLAPNRQQVYYDYIIDLKPHRVLFNPGTENPELTRLLDLDGIQWENACTLVLLSTNQYQT
jgi:predicted CoA-binding protein